MGNVKIIYSHKTELFRYLVCVTVGLGIIKWAEVSEKSHCSVKLIGAWQNPALNWKE